MLKLRDFLHLPQLDSLMSQLVAEESGLIVLAGIEARPVTAQPGESFTPSGLSAIFNILMQEILLAHPMAQAIVVAEEKALARVPRPIARRVRAMRVDPAITTYAQQIEAAMHQRPSLLVIDQLSAESAASAFRAAHSGLRVLTQLDSVLRGPAVAHQIVDLGVPRAMLAEVRWIMTNQRMAVLCERCKRPVASLEESYGQLRTRYPHLSPAIEQLIQPEEGQKAAREVKFHRAGGCEHCRGTGYSGDMAVFDIFRNDPAHPDFFTQASLLSLEEYALHLAAEGQLDLDDLLGLESDHLRRTYQMLTASEQALRETNTTLQRKVFELEASNRVLVQRTEVQMALQDLGQALITSSDLADLAGRICRRASELCGADRVVLYLRHPTAEGEKEMAEILSVRGWEESRVGQHVEARDIYDLKAESKIIRYTQVPPGFRQEPASTDRTASAIRMGLRVPLVAQEHYVGVMVVQSTQKDFFTPGESSLLQTFANQAALAIQRAGLVDDLRAKIAQLEAAQAELVKKERLDRELELARQVQQSMLPSSFPKIPGYAVSAHNEPARQVGGDFYDLFRLDEDHFGVVIADVSDKGMPAALYMALTRSLLLAEARRVLSPRSAMLNVNRLLLDLGDVTGFVSVFYGVVECSTRRLVYARAGHERPLLLRDSQTLYLGGEGLVLGVLPEDEMNLSEEQIDLLPGDRLVLYTDGLTDVINAGEQFLRLAGLEKFFLARAQLDPEPFCQAIFDDLNDYRGAADQFDDMTLLVLSIEK